MKALRRLARFDVVPGHPPGRPAQHCATSQFGSAVADYHLRQGSLEGQPFQFSDHAYSAQRGVDHRSKTLAAEIVDDPQNAETPTVA